MTESYLYLLVKAIVVLTFVLGLLVASLYLLKRFYGARGLTRGGKNPVRVLTTAFLGQKKNLAVVEVAGEVLVLGITPGSITCLSKVEDPRAIEELKSREASGTRPFFGIFQ